MLIDHLREQAALVRQDLARALDPDWADELSDFLDELEAEIAAH